MQRYGRSFLNRGLTLSTTSSGIGASTSTSTNAASALAGAAALNFLPSQMRFNATAAPKKKRNPYKVLGVKPSASVAELKKAHRVLARKFHPDVPGGSHEKFQEVQEAYEQVKTGVWINKDPEPRSGEDGGSEKPANRYANFRYTTGGNTRKQSYDETFSNFRRNKDAAPDDDMDMAAAEADKKRRGAAAMFGPDSPIFQAWSRLILVWSCAFVVMRLGLFMAFPPKYERAPKKKMSERPRLPPPPKPLASNSPVL